MLEEQIRCGGVEESFQRLIEGQLERPLFGNCFRGVNSGKALDGVHNKTFYTDRDRIQDQEDKFKFKFKKLKLDVEELTQADEVVRVDKFIQVDKLTRSSRQTRSGVVYLSIYNIIIFFLKFHPTA